MNLLLLLIFSICKQFSTTQDYSILPALSFGVTKYKHPTKNNSTIDIGSLLLYAKNIRGIGKTKFQQLVQLQDKNTFALKSPLLNLQLSHDR